jgi:high affinity Mn2+ porin
MPRAWAALALLLLAARPAHAGVSEAEGRADDAFDFMNLITRHGLHDIAHERWNAYGQLTWISSFKLPFSAPYTNANGSTNSLHPDFEHSFTGTATLYFGLALWPGAEVYWVPELVTEHPLSNLAGLGGAIQNFELQKQGSVEPVVYNARLYFRQTLGLGGARDTKTSDPLQLGTVVDRRRVVLTIGNFSVLDLFDKNSFSGDLRRQFFNMAFLSYAAFDFAADARGYTWGAVAELYFDDWAFRIGRAVAPEHPNQLALDFRFWQYYGDQLEIEHVHALRGHPGAIRILAYRNHENIGRFDEAITAHARDPNRNATTCSGFSYGSQNVSAPDLCWARRPGVKMGIGINLEQSIGADVGLFLRGMFSDGESEVYSYTSTDMSLSFGALARGTKWRRPVDLCGIGVGLGWISSSHADYLRQGGVDGFVGDGRLNPAPETVVETFYGLNLFSSVWLSADYQLIANPGFNADRGPVHVLGARAHAEF